MSPLAFDISLPTILSSVVLAALASAFFAYRGTVKSLKANQPVTNATADEKQAATNRTNIETQQGVIKTLEGQLERQEKRAELMQSRMEALELRLEEAEQQAELSAAATERAEAAAKVSKQHLAACRERNRILSAWVESHYAAEHPEADRPPADLYRI